MTTTSKSITNYNVVTTFSHVIVYGPAGKTECLSIARGMNVKGRPKYVEVRKDEKQYRYDSSCLQLAELVLGTNAPRFDVERLAQDLRDTIEDWTACKEIEVALASLAPQPTRLIGGEYREPPPEEQPT